MSFAARYEGIPSRNCFGVSVTTCGGSYTGVGSGFLTTSAPETNPTDRPKANTNNPLGGLDFMATIEKDKDMPDGGDNTPIVADGPVGKKPGSVTVPGVPVRTEEPCSCCPEGANGIPYCIDGALHVLPFPTDGGGWVLEFIPGVGIGWLNKGEIVNGPGEGFKKKPSQRKPRKK